MEFVKYDKYISELILEFPDIERESLTRIVKHGLLMISMLMPKNMDVYLNNDREKLYYYFGEIMTDLEKRNLMSTEKYRKKLRYLYKLNKTEYDGYYYFCLTEQEYDSFLKKEPITVYMYKIKEEALIKKGAYLFKVPKEETKKLVYKVEQYIKTEELEYEKCSK